MAKTVTPLIGAGPSNSFTASATSASNRMEKFFHQDVKRKVLKFPLITMNWASGDTGSNTFYFETSALLLMAAIVIPTMTNGSVTVNVVVKDENDTTVVTWASLASNSTNIKVPVIDTSYAWSIPLTTGSIVGTVSSDPGASGLAMTIQLSFA